MSNASTSIPRGRDGKLRVYHFAASAFGGASIAARRLFDSLAGHDIDALFFSGDTDPQADALRYKQYVPQLKKDPISRLRYRSMRKQFLELEKALPGRPEGLELFHHSQHYYPTELPKGYPVPDIVHLHWIAGLIDYSSFFKSIPTHVPVVWTLHDMHPFTGGCHYAWECERYKTGCEACPQLNGYDNGEAARINSDVKQKALQGHRIHLAADSHWLDMEAANSLIFRGAASHQAIHYGLDFDQFKPVDKAEARAALNLPTDAPVIAFGADSATNKRKGLPELLAALDQINNPESVHCIVFGRMDEQLASKSRANIHLAGFLKTPEEQCRVYSAADCFVIPSLYEAFGQTSLEAMACERPVIGFDTGGIPDMVQHNQTGLLVPRGDVDALASAIDQLIANPSKAIEMGRYARQFAIENFNLDLQFSKYMALYAAALGQ